MRQLVVLLALSLQFSACGESPEPVDGPVTQSELSDDRRRCFDGRRYIARGGTDI